MSGYQDFIDRLIFGSGTPTGLQPPQQAYDPSFGGLLSAQDRQRAFGSTLANMATAVTAANQRGVGTGGLIAATAQGLAQGRDFYSAQALARAKEEQAYSQGQKDREAWRKLFTKAGVPLPGGLSEAEGKAVALAGPQSGVASTLLSRGTPKPSDQFGQPFRGEDGNLYQYNLTTGKIQKIDDADKAGVNVTVDLGDKTAQKLSENAYKEIQSAQKAVDAQSSILSAYNQMEAIAQLGLENGWQPNALAGLGATVEGLGRSMGMDVDFGAQYTRPIQGASNQLALFLRNPDSGGGLTGNTSNADLQFLKQSVPQATDTPEAFFTLMLVNKKRTEFAIAYQEAKQDELMKNNGMLTKEFRDEWRNKRFLTEDDRNAIRKMAEDRRQSSSAIQAPSANELPELPPGMTWD